MAEPLAVCICGEHLEIHEDGVLCVRSGAFGPRLTLIFKSSGQFSATSYPWLSKVVAKVQAGGGASGGASSTPEGGRAAGAGGGGGGYAEALVDASVLSSTELVTVGAGGSGSTANGGDGGFSAFGSHCFATGGSGGGAMGTGNENTALSFSSLALPASGGVGTVGDVLMWGGQGSFGWAIGGLALRKGGRGGNSRFGGGRGGRVTAGNGVEGRPNTGEGAGGASNGGNSGAKAGGGGGSGIVILELYG